jgi:replicative DNA helicase
MTTMTYGPDAPSLDAERALLGSALLAPYDLPDLAAVVQPTDFYLHAHRWIWDALVDAGESADVVTISDRLATTGQLEEAGGMAYLTRLMTDTPTSANAGAYAALVAQAGRRRALIALATRVAQGAINGGDPDALAAEAVRDLDKLGRGLAVGEIGTAAQAVEGWYDNFAEFVKTGNIPGLTTGYRIIDRKTLGLKRKELVILAARPSMGKTSLAAQMSVRQARAGLRVAVFSLEVTKESWVEAAALAELGIDKTKAKPDDLAAVTRKCEEIYNLPLVFFERGFSGMAEIEAAARQMERQLGGLDVIIGDHLGYVDHLKGEKSTSLPYLIGLTTKRLAKLGKDMNAAVVWLCQLSRASAKEKAEPQLTDLRDSGEIEQDARQVWFLHRPGYYADPEPPADKGQEARLLVRKNHEGPTGLISLAFVKATRRFAEIDVVPR